MVDITVYVERLRTLRTTNPEKYTQMMTYYKNTYPEIHARLEAALNQPTVQAQPSNQASVNVDVYVQKLKSLKMQSLEKYNQTLDYYKTNHPAFYNQLITKLNTVAKPTRNDSLKEFIREYKFYLIAIFVGVGVIIYLLFLLMTR